MVGNACTCAPCSQVRSVHGAGNMVACSWIGVILVARRDDGKRSRIVEACASVACVLMIGAMGACGPTGTARTPSEQNAGGSVSSQQAQVTRPNPLTGAMNEIGTWFSSITRSIRNAF